MKDNSGTILSKGLQKNNNLFNLNKLEIENNFDFKKLSITKIKNENIMLDINSNIIKKEINQKIKKIRNPGIDALRIISMYNIILTHYIDFGHLYRNYPKYKRHLAFIHSFTDWHNNSFILISGIVGYKTNKYSNLLYLWITVFFYSVGIHKYIVYYKNGYKVNNDMYQEYYPITFKRYWYFTTYFAMYLFLPVLNKGIEYLSKYEFRFVVMSLLCILVFWKDYKNPYNDVYLMFKGYSLIWFLIYYLTGAYIGKYRTNNYLGIKKLLP